MTKGHTVEHFSKFLKIIFQANKPYRSFGNAMYSGRSGSPRDLNVFLNELDITGIPFMLKYRNALR